MDIRSDYPAFMETLDECDPWDIEPCFLKLFHDTGSKASFFKPDVWHTVNLGVGRSWVSNCIVMLIGALGDLKAMSQDEVLQYLSTEYVAFCESSVPCLVDYSLSIFVISNFGGSVEEHIDLALIW